MVLGGDDCVTWNAFHTNLNRPRDRLFADAGLHGLVTTPDRLDTPDINAFYPHAI